MTKSVAAGLAAYATDSDLRAAKVRMGHALPDEGWLADYLRAVTPLTDAPVEFHLISGMCALSGAIGNRLFAEHWGQTVFPHLWAVLVAPSSFWRKSTSINQAEGLLRASAPDQVIPSDFSREKLLDMLSKHPDGLMTQKEFGGFLSNLARDYNGGAKETLTELYDGPDLYTRALKSQTYEVRRPALSILGATTLDWLEGKIVEGDLGGGFLPRFLWVTARDKASGKGLTGSMEPGLRVRLTTGLHSIAAAKARGATYTPDAHEALEAWMEGWEAEATKASHRSDLSGFATRLQTYAVKLSMLYRVSRTYGDDPQDHVVDEASVEQAIAYVRLLWANVTGLIDDKIAITKDAKELRRLDGIIGKGITRGQALKLSKLKARDFDQFLDTLVQGGDVVVVKAKASELGIDRARDTNLTWLARSSSNGHVVLPNGSSSSLLAVQANRSGTGGEPEEPDNWRELQGPDLSSESPSSSTSLSSLIPNESPADAVGVRARERTGSATPESIL